MSAQVNHDPNSGRVYVRLTKNDVIESEEVAPGIVVDYDRNGDVVAVEIDLVAAKKTPLP